MAWVAGKLTTETLAVGLNAVTLTPGSVVTSAETAPDTACVAGRLLTVTLVTGLVTVTLAVGEKDVTAMAGILVTDVDRLPDTAIGLATVHAEIAKSSPIVRSPDTACTAGKLLTLTDVTGFVTVTLAVGLNAVMLTPGRLDTAISSLKLTSPLTATVAVAVQPVTPTFGVVFIVPDIRNPLAASSNDAFMT
jgi:hypothetical protein